MIQLKQDNRLRMIGPLTIGSWLLLLWVCLVVYCVNLGEARVLTGHEIDVAGGARQMISEGDWLIPRIGDHTWLEKPPLLHWLVASLMILFGESAEWVVRLPSVVAGVILVFLMAMMVGRWIDEKAGLLAGFIQCTSWYMMTYARLSEADILLACFVVSAIIVFIHLQGIGLPQPSSRPRLWAMVFWILIGLTNLCKGPMFGAVMALTPCLAWLLWRREPSAWKRMWSPAGLVLGIFIAAAWPTLVLLEEPSALDLWLYHTVGRAKGDTGYGGPWYYYLGQFPVRLLPWTLLTLIGAPASLKRMWREADSVDRFTCLWALAPMFLLSLCDGKHHHYLLPSLPGFLFITVKGMHKLGQHIQQRGKYTVAVAWGEIGVISPALLTAGLVVGFNIDDYRVDVLMLAGLFSVGFLLMGIFTLNQQPTRVFITFLLVFVLSAVHVHLYVMPKQDDRRQDRQFLLSLHEGLPPNALLFAAGEGDRIVRHIFYVQHPLTGVWETEDISKYLGEEKVFFVVGRMNIFESLERFGNVTVVSQSEYTRNEQSPRDRYTLFRIQRPELW
jgi:4-amino-4-deoxy-L-arabinose transferase-like glycosyltransferase